MWYDLWAIAKALVLTEKWAATGGFWIVQWNVLTLIFKGSFCCVTNRLRKGEARLEVDWLRLLQLSRQEIMGYFERRENQGKEGLKDASWAWDLAQRHCKHSREFNTQNQKKNQMLLEFWVWTTWWVVITYWNEGNWVEERYILSEHLRLKKVSRSQIMKKLINLAKGIGPYLINNTKEPFALKLFQRF